MTASALPDLALRWLRQQVGVTNLTIADLEPLSPFPTNLALTLLGYTGAYPDKLKQYLIDELGEPEAHRYWRLTFTGDNGDPNNIILLTYIGMSVDGNTTEVLDDSMTASASSTYFGAPGDEVLFNATNPLNPPSGSGWATASGSTWPQWWKVDVGAGNELFPTSFWITPQTVARSPSGIILAYSDDDENWTDVETFTSTTGWTAGQIRQFVLT